MDRVLLVFQKNPVPGNVKTRLAASVGDERALQIYKKLIQHTKKVIEPVSATKQIWYSSIIETDDDWDYAKYQKFKQEGAGLGERMLYSFKCAFEDPLFNKVVIIGTDCVEITKDLIEKAFLSLESYDFVIGPANDGGYYLLGMNSFNPEIFNGVEWSTDTVLSSTLNKIKDGNRSVFLLPTLSDIDTLDDWNKAKAIIDDV